MGLKSNILIIVLAILLFIGFGSSAENAIDPDEKLFSISSEDIMLQKTSWSKSYNPASLFFFDFEDKLAKAYMNFDFANENYKKFLEAYEKRNLGFCTNGYVKLKKWKFYGDFNYFNQKENNISWVDVMEPYNDNPYIIGDSIGGDYSKEFFSMRAKASLQTNSKLLIGFDVSYNTGVGAKRKDPRPQNIFTSFDIKPGIIWHHKNLILGANLQFQTSKENIEMSTVTERTFNIFHFKGLGAYSSTTELDDRSNIMILYGGGVQIGYENDRFSNVTEGSFSYEQTDIKRGTSHPLQVVLLDKFETRVLSVFNFKAGGLNVRKLELNFLNKKIYGHEPVVEPKLEQVNYQWNTIAKYTLYWNSITSIGANYCYYKLIDSDHYNWGGNLSVDYQNTETSYYFVPEYNQQTFNSLNLNVKIEKGFNKKRMQYVLTGITGYKLPLENTKTLVEDELLLENIQVDFFNTDFNYHTSQLIKVGISAKVARDIKLYNLNTQIYIDTSYKILISDIPGSKNRNYFEMSLGVNF